jgi:tetratricopeptide (TPR) repeat protein
MTLGRLAGHIAELPGWGMILSCRCFAHEEAGNYTLAEGAGRQAIEVDPGDLWGAHAIAHVLEMQGRRSEGIDWLKRLEPNWEGANNLKHHLFWHRAMFHIERREFDEVLSLYDHGFRDLGSPLTLAIPDMYIDVQNAASMLFRLERQGVDVGDRWVELADKAEARIGDCLSAFTLPHWMMALAATGRAEAAQRMIAAMREFANGQGTTQTIVRDYALPVAEAVLARAGGRHAEAVATMRPVLGGMFRLGGSHAQQDVLEQLFVDAGLKSGLDEDVRLALERIAGRRVVPPQRWVGWREAAQRVAV